MGVLIDVSEDKDLYKDKVLEAQSFISNSDVKKKSVIEDIIELVSEYDTAPNFHLPRISRLISHHYQETNISLDPSELCVKNFPLIRGGFNCRW